MEKKVIFSDESKINRILSDGRSWCWKKQDEFLLPRHVKQTIKFDGGSFMVCELRRTVNQLRTRIF